MGFIKNSIKSLINSVVKLSRPIFSFENNEFKFKINTENFYTFPIEDYETKTRHDSYVLEAYTLNSDDIFMEYIQVDSSTTWNGLASAFFIDLFKNELAITSMKVLEKKTFNHYEFITYELDEDIILNFIYIYEVNKDIFIIDSKSHLYTSLIKQFDKKYEYTFKNSDEKLNIDISLVNNNMIESYFSSSD